VGVRSKKEPTFDALGRNFVMPMQEGKKCPTVEKEGNGKKAPSDPETLTERARQMGVVISLFWTSALR